MKRMLNYKFVFRSLLWSFLLFALSMLVINWDDLGSRAGKDITIKDEHGTLVHPADIAPKAATTVGGLFFIVNSITGIVKEVLAPLAK